MDRCLAKPIVMALLVLGTCSAWVLRNEDNQERAPLQRKSPQKNHLDYLKKYGYFGHLVSKAGGPNPTTDEVREAIESMQRFAGLPVTGEIDEKTAEMMSKPRCGVKDSPHQPRYGVPDLDRKWFHNNVTYTILNFSPDLDDEVIRSDVRAALDLWSAASPLRFTELTYDQAAAPVATADIRIRFASGDHSLDRDAGEDEAFDGVGGVLAHAFSPNAGEGALDGDVHLDDDETFTHESHRGTNLLYILTHEIGHALGLGHSSVDEAVMYSTYYAYRPNLTLHQDDIEGMQTLYGSLG